MTTDTFFSRIQHQRRNNQNKWPHIMCALGRERKIHERSAGRSERGSKKVRQTVSESMMGMGSGSAFFGFEMFSSLTRQHWCNSCRYPAGERRSPGRSFHRFIKMVVEGRGGSISNLRCSDPRRSDAQSLGRDKLRVLQEAYPRLRPTSSSPNDRYRHSPVIVVLEGS